jgi:hypothetical protein
MPMGIALRALAREKFQIQVSSPLVSIEVVCGVDKTLMTYYKDEYMLSMCLCLSIDIALRALARGQ